MKSGMAVEGYLLRDGTVKPLEKYDDTELRAKIQTNTDNIDNLDSEVEELQSVKADKVKNATSGNLAALDEKGNLTDSGKKASDFATASHNHDSAYAAKIHNHNADYVSKYNVELPATGFVLPIPKFVKVTDVSDPIDLDTLISHDEGATMDAPGFARLCLENAISASSEQVWVDLLTSSGSLPIHANSNSAATFDEGEFVMLTVYRLDKGESEHDHDMCYFVTLDGIFDSGNA